MEESGNAEGAEGKGQARMGEGPGFRLLVLDRRLLSGDGRAPGLSLGWEMVVPSWPGNLDRSSPETPHPHPQSRVLSQPESLDKT